MLTLTSAPTVSAYERVREAELAHYEELAEEETGTPWFADEWELMKKLTFDEYCRALSTAMERRLIPYVDRKKVGDDDPALQPELARTKTQWHRAFQADRP